MAVLSHLYRTSIILMLGYCTVPQVDCMMFLLFSAKSLTTVEIMPRSVAFNWHISNSLIGTPAYCEH